MILKLLNITGSWLVNNRIFIFLFLLTLSLPSFAAKDRSWVRQITVALNEKLAIVGPRVRAVIIPEYIHQRTKISSPFLRTSNVKTTRKLGSLTVEVFSPKVDSHFRRVINEIVKPEIAATGVDFDIIYTLLPKEPKPPVVHSEVIISDPYAKDTFVFLQDTLFPLIKNLGLGLIFLMFIRLAFELRKAKRVAASNLEVENQQDVKKVRPETTSSGKNDQSRLSDEKILEGMKDDSLLALLTDCYWCEEDSYAKYIWNKLTESKQLELVKKSTILNSYSGFLEKEIPQDLNLLKDSYYLNPLFLFHISNKDLSGLIRKNKQLISQVSLLRKKTITMQYKEIISSPTAVGPGPVIDNNYLSSFNPSIKRNLNTTFNTFSSVVDEEKFFAGNPGLAYMKNHPSLGWSRHLSDEQVREILGHFNILDLAAAWIGPEEDLKRMALLLDEKSQAKLESLLKIFDPSYNVSTYKHLWRQILKSLMSANQTKVAV
jgi:hypothetical protein